MRPVKKNHVNSHHPRARNSPAGRTAAHGPIARRAERRLSTAAQPHVRADRESVYRTHFDPKTHAFPAKNEAFLRPLADEICLL